VGARDRPDPPPGAQARHTDGSRRAGRAIPNRAPPGLARDGSPDGTLREANRHEVLKEESHQAAPTTPIERLDGDINHRSIVVGILPSDKAIVTPLPDTGNHRSDGPMIIPPSACTQRHADQTGSPRPSA
jgi:hypothetical protein